MQRAAAGGVSPRPVAVRVVSEAARRAAAEDVRYWESCTTMTTDERAPGAPASRPRVRDFWADLPREGRFLLSIVVLEFLGTGLVLPFNVVYLHEVRGFP